MVGVDASTATSATAAAAPGAPISVSYADLPQRSTSSPTPGCRSRPTRTPARRTYRRSPCSRTAGRSSSTTAPAPRSSSAATAACRRCPRVVPVRRRHCRPRRVRARQTSDARGLESVAVALMGANAGAVVARQGIADPSLYLELPVGVFGNAAGGVVDRVRAPGAVMIGHVDVSGSPVELTRRRRCGGSTRTGSSATARGRGRSTSNAAPTGRHRSPASRRRHPPPEAVASTGRRSARPTPSAASSRRCL